MAVGDIYQMAIRGQYEGQLVVNVSTYRMKSGIDIVTQWENMADAWYFTFRSLFNNGYRMDVARFRMLVPFGLQHEATFPSPGTGTIAGTGSAATNAVLVTWFTAVGGRSRRGRTFWPPPTITSTSGSQLITAYKTSIETQLTQWLGAFKGGGTDPNTEMGVWSRKIAGAVPPYNPLAFQPVTSATVSSVIAVQRRRRIGTGR